LDGQSQGFAYTQLRDAASNILQTEDGLLKIVQLVGEDSLEPSQKLTLEIAKIVREDFLQQDAFSDHDFTCPIEKSLGILRCIIHLHDACLKRIMATAPEPGAASAAAVGSQFTWNQLIAAKPELVHKVSRLKFLVSRGFRLKPSQCLLSVRPWGSVALPVCCFAIAWFV
jgi:V-type H+-transporting ATPase subunit A